MDSDVIREGQRDDILRVEALRLASTSSASDPEDVVYRAKLYYAFLSDLEFDPNG